ncbi:MAG TPA: ABC transporter permease subunit [Vicinamibacterales bacterium]|nr:ABC transporter permease subunit [Vicinamibacterales bacterium]
MGAWIMAGVTFREAARKRILWTALIVGVAFLAVFGAALHYQMADFAVRATIPFLRYQILSAMLLIGLYVVDLLAVLMTILTSIETVSGEIASGTIHAIATKPMARWQLLLGKWLGSAVMVLAFVTLTFGGTMVVAWWIGGVVPEHPLQGLLLVALECLLALAVTFAAGTWCSTLTNGVIVLGLFGLAFLGGWLEQMSGFTESARLMTIGIVTSLIMPSEALWRRAVFEMQSPLAGALPFSPFATVSIPSGTMIGYAGVYLLAALGVAVWHFQRRDL